MRSSPRLRVVYLLIISITLGFTAKSVILSTNLYACLILVSTGVLLLLFYTAIVNDKFLYWQSKYGLLLAAAPFIYKSVNYQGSCLAAWVESLKHKATSGFVWMTLLLGLLLIVVNSVPSKVKFIRQII